MVLKLPKPLHFEMKKLLPLVIALFTVSCGSDPMHHDERDLEGHQFDHAMIDKLPIFDSLRQLIISNYDSFRIGGAFNDFTYVHNFDTAAQPTLDIPSHIYPSVAHFFKMIGSDLEGFTLSKDSTLKFMLREWANGNHVMESMYWYPYASMIRPAELKRRSNAPRSYFQDTVVNSNWQYELEAYEIH